MSWVKSRVRNTSATASHDRFPSAVRVRAYVWSSHTSITYELWSSHMSWVKSHIWVCFTYDLSQVTHTKHTSNCLTRPSPFSLACTYVRTCTYVHTYVYISYETHQQLPHKIEPLQKSVHVRTYMYVRTYVCNCIIRNTPATALHDQASSKECELEILQAHIYIWMRTRDIIYTPTYI